MKLAQSIDTQFVHAYTIVKSKRLTNKPIVWVFPTNISDLIKKMNCLKIKTAICHHSFFWIKFWIEWSALSTIKSRWEKRILHLNGNNAEKKKKCYPIEMSVGEWQFNAHKSTKFYVAPRLSRLAAASSSWLISCCFHLRLPSWHSTKFLPFFATSFVIVHRIGLLFSSI